MTHRITLTPQQTALVVASHGKAAQAQREFYALVHVLTAGSTVPAGHTLTNIDTDTSTLVFDGD